jgi:hypothetical protein
MKMRALCSETPKKKVFFKTLFDFSKMDIKKMSKIEKPGDFLKKICY